ncbi:CAMK/CDPK protein kinase [Plasmodium falciparum RAJ116]|uniref:CAMK/CDPK protein kinase n=1 Tax=Plasmodium falciparum RAJ116 TaxID=580058 RepID=A0A0L0CSN7_PLAFA|nr:CAMK/CDPK protein kinase [Plasmodium falciparum RAJ116]
MKKGKLLIYCGKKKGCPPFNGSNEYDILKKVEAGKYTFDLPQFKKISDKAKDLIKKMLMYTSAVRISARDALEHEWIKMMTSKDNLNIDIPSLELSIANIRQFQSTQKLAQAALLYMGSKLTTIDETKELTKIFKKMDKNGDGQLDRNELIIGYKELLKLKGEDTSDLDNAAIEYEVDQILNSIDLDQNGYIEYSEFLTVSIDRKLLLSTERLEKAFKLFDKDGSGKISANELAQLFGLSDVSSECWKTVLKEVDQNNDGEIDFKEFRDMLVKLCNY